MAPQSRKPQIFLSSTIDDLVAERAEIERDVLLRGWRCWLWERSYEAGSIRARIRCGLARSSYVIVVLGPRYGSTFGWENLSATEWELSLARQLRKPLAIYWLQAGAPVDATQRSLWETLKHTDDLNITEVTRDGLQDAVSHDLDLWASGHYRHPRFFASEQFRAWTRAPRRSAGNESPRIDADETQTRLDGIRSLRDRELYLEADLALKDLLPAIRCFASPGASLDKLYALRDFLNLAANINHVRGRHEQAKASTLAALQVGWHLPDSHGRRRSASATSGIFSRDHTGVALAASDFARERTSDPEELAGISDGRAAIRLAQGKIDEAAKLLREAVVQHGRPDNILGYLHTRLGSTLRATKRRREWDAVDQAFEDADRLIQDFPLSRVMLRSAQIPHLIDAHGDLAQAAELHALAISECRHYGLVDPLRGLAELNAQYQL